MKFYLIAICSIILDQITKNLILIKFSGKLPGYSEKILGDFFYFTFVQNKGTAFGLKLITSPWPVLASTLFVFILLTYHIIQKTKAQLFMYGLSLILGGAIGNLIDRFKYGYVVDFMDIRVWPVFNVADIVITIGVIMVILHLFLNPAEENKKIPMTEERSITSESSGELIA